MNSTAYQFHICRLRQQAWEDRRFAEDLYTQISRLEHQAKEAERQERLAKEKSHERRENDLRTDSK